MWKFQYFLLLSLIYFINNAEGLKCYKCGSLNEKSCFGDFKNLDLVECAADEVSCFTKLVNSSRIVRGCKAKESKCLSDLCRECDQDGCNTNIVCYECGSEKKGNCTGSTMISVCPGGKDKCMTWVKEDKLVEQQCVDSSVKCDEDKTKTCHICTTSFCLDPFKLFPKDRRLCYQCLEDYNANCDKLESVKPLPCKFYDENEKCYSMGTSDMNMKRGCMSDIGHKCFGESCVTCDKDGCNNQLYIRQPSRKCFQCGPKDKTCSKEALPCKNSIEYWKQSEGCFTQTVPGKVLQGCVNDRAANAKPCNAKNSCKICDTDGCNFIVGVNDEDYPGQEMNGEGDSNEDYTDEYSSSAKNEIFDNDG